MAFDGKLNREEIEQLSDENAKFLEREVSSLSLLLNEKKLNAKVFWKRCKDIHSLFKRITPIRKEDRKKWWEEFKNIRELAKKRIDKETYIQDFVTKKLEKEVGILVSEMKEILGNPQREPYEIEYLIFLSSQLNSFLKGDFSNLPDTPDLSLIRCYLDIKPKIAKENLKEIRKVVKKAHRFLESLSLKLFSNCRDLIDKVRNNETSDKEKKVVLKKLREEIIISPLLKKEQKDIIVKELNGLNSMDAQQPFSEIKESKNSHKVSLESFGELNLIIEELKEKFLE